MEIKVTVQELYDMGLLDKFCEVKRIPEKSALADCDVYALTEEEAVKIGLIRENNN